MESTADHGKHRRRPVVVRIAVVVVLSMWLPSAFAQTEAPPPTATATPAPTAIPTAEIPTRLADLGMRLQDIRSRAAVSPEVAALEEQLTGQLGDIDARTDEIAELIDTGGPSGVLRDAQADAARLGDRTAKWLAVLEPRATAIDQNLTELEGVRQRWLATRDRAVSDGLPAALIDQISDSLNEIKTIEDQLAARRAEVLTLQTRIAERQSRLGQLQDQLRAETDRRQQDLLSRDSPPIWRAVTERRAVDGLGEQVVGTLQRNADAIRSYFREDAALFMFHTAVFGLLLALFVQLGRRAVLWSRSDGTLHAAAELLRRPVASSLLVTIVLVGGGSHATGPTALLHLLAFVLLLVMLRLLPSLVRREMLPAVTMMVVLVALYLVVDLIPNAYLLNRLGTLALSALGLATCLWVARRARRLEPPLEGPWYRIAHWLVRAAALLFALAVGANVLGFVGLSEWLFTATLGAAYDALLLWVLVAVIFGAVTVGLRTQAARRVRIVRYHEDRIRSVVLRLVRFVAVVTWAGMALDGFGYLSGVRSAVAGVLFYEIRFGDVSLSISNVLLFVAVVWLAHKLAQLLGFVLGEDVLPRIDLPRGAAPAITKMTQYAVLTLGLVLAVAAAGLDVSQLTIVIGALGVGIGFGLQNVVNNFVSGLILLFERPVNLGDRIDVGGLSGVVKDIGIRASVVRTWQGADVVVPNATLISDNLVNWTLTDPQRRMEIPVGVAYGTDPDRVLGLLIGVAQAHPEVLDEPSPVALFTGFGSSSLDFELRAWTVGDFITIASELRVAINRALADDGIEIPFPQRDLHLRSVAGPAAENLAGGPAPPAERTGPGGNE